MSDQRWKALERWAAKIIGGTRHWANSGESIDVESVDWAGQCKLLKECSLEAMTQLAERIEATAQAKGKRGVLIIKVRRGKGNQSTALCILTADAWEDTYKE